MADKKRKLNIFDNFRYVEKGQYKRRQKCKSCKKLFFQFKKFWDKNLAQKLVNYNKFENAKKLCK